MSVWTKPYHGVQHLNGLRSGFQITVNDRDGFAECLVFLPGHGFNAKSTQHADAAEARAYGEKQAADLRAAA